MSVEDRNLLWNEAREQKLESMRRMTSDPELDECTFQPNLLSKRCTRRSYRSTVRRHDNILQSSSVQKYLFRMNKARHMKFMKEYQDECKPGSGKIWQNKLTVPREPRFRVSSSDRSRSRK